MGYISDWNKDTSIPQTKAEKEEYEKSGKALKCVRYTDKLIYCIGASSQGKEMYESGMMRNCDVEWEEIKWCTKAQFGDERSKQRLLERSRKTNHNLDALPWEYKPGYLQYMLSEDRLPSRMSIRVLMEQHNQSEQQMKATAADAKK